MDLRGDTNTRYFHMIVSHNFKKYIIHRLIIDGSEVRDQEHIKLHAYNFYKDFLAEGG
jgi:hypothetical protein